MRKPLPIGISGFKELMDGGYAYADKTLLIAEAVENSYPTQIYCMKQTFPVKIQPFKGVIYGKRRERKHKIEKH